MPALAIMLGANVGTTLIVQLLSFNVAAVAPVLFIVGLVAFRSGRAAAIKDLGRVAIGLGLMLLALHILLDTLAPAESAPSVRGAARRHHRRSRDVHPARGALTWAAHSSVATVLLIMSLAFSHFVTPMAALALVLGANLGSAINPVLEGGDRGDPASYRLPVGNLINRLVGVVLVVAIPAADRRRAFAPFSPIMARMTAEFHIAFNVALAVVFIGLLDPLAWLLVRLFPARKAPPIPPRRAISTRPRSRRPRSRWPTPRARRCAWATCRDHAAAGHDAR